MPVALLAVGSLVVVKTSPSAEKPAETPANPENIQAALQLTQAAAAEYEIRVAGDDKPLDLRREPVALVEPRTRRGAWCCTMCCS